MRPPRHRGGGGGARGAARRGRADHRRHGQVRRTRTALSRHPHYLHLYTLITSRPQVQRGAVAGAAGPRADQAPPPPRGRHRDRQVPRPHPVQGPGPDYRGKGVN